MLLAVAPHDAARLLEHGRPGAPRQAYERHMLGAVPAMGTRMGRGSLRRDSAKGFGLRSIVISGPFF
jgi:hypothetical protein